MANYSTRRARERKCSIDFPAINAAALAELPMLLQRLLPGGRFEGSEYVALNPRRADRHLGSFRANWRTGKWADFALADARGGDPVSHLAYLENCSQSEAARRLAAMLGISVGGRHG
jgi:hypothetical protein